MLLECCSLTHLVYVKSKVAGAPKEIKNSSVILLCAQLTAVSFLCGDFTMVADCCPESRTKYNLVTG